MDPMATQYSRSYSIVDYTAQYAYNFATIYHRILKLNFQNRHSRQTKICPKF